MEGGSEGWKWEVRGEKGEARKGGEGGKGTGR